MVVSNESIEEIREYLNSKESYLTDAGKIKFTYSTDTLNAVLKFMSRDKPA